MTSDMLEPAYILHARNYRDTSRIIELLARETGRYSAVARGAASARSKLRGRLQLFTPLLVASVGRGELKTVTTVDFPAGPYRLSGRRLLLGMYVNELMYRLLGRFVPAPGLYDGYERLLAGLQARGDGILAVRRFELELLQELGYGVDFACDARNGRPVAMDASYRYVVHEGFHEYSGADGLGFSGRELLGVAAGELAAVDEKRLRRLTRMSLAELLGDKPLRSRSLFRSRDSLEPVVVNSLEPVVTDSPERVVTDSLEPVVVDSPERVVTDSLERVVTDSPERVVTDSPEPVAPK